MKSTTSSIVLMAETSRRQSKFARAFYYRPDHPCDPNSPTANPGHDDIGIARTSKAVVRRVSRQDRETPFTEALRIHLTVVRIWTPPGDGAAWAFRHGETVAIGGPQIYSGTQVSTATIRQRD